MKKFTIYTVIFSMLAASAFFAACGNPAGPEAPYTPGVVIPVPTVITSVAVTNITVPATGQTPLYNYVVGGNYSVETVTWNNKSPTFQPTSTYTVTVILTANSGFTFTGLVTATINGNPATITNNDGATVTLEYPFPQTTALPPTDITNVTVTGITIPVTGDTPVTTAAVTGSYTVKSISWSPNDNPFAGGVAYRATALTLIDILKSI